MSKGLKCEPSFFEDINTVAIVEKYGHVRCKKVKVVVALHAPSVEVLTDVCYIQDHLQAYSCMRREMEIRRICPCRDYENEQSAICKNCL